MWYMIIRMRQDEDVSTFIAYKRKKNGKTVSRRHVCDLAQNSLPNHGNDRELS